MRFCAVPCCSVRWLHDGAAPGVEGVEPALLAKARKLAVAVGAAAGAFGGLVGLAGGVLIAPVIANACRCGHGATTCATYATCTAIIEKPVRRFQRRSNLCVAGDAGRELAGF